MTNKQSLSKRIIGFPIKAIKKMARKILQLGEVVPYVSVNISTIEDDNKLKGKNKKQEKEKI